MISFGTFSTIGLLIVGLLLFIFMGRIGKLSELQKKTVRTYRWFLAVWILVAGMLAFFNIANKIQNRVPDTAIVEGEQRIRDDDPVPALVAPKVQTWEEQQQQFHDGKL